MTFVLCKFVSIQKSSLFELFLPKICTLPSTNLFGPQNWVSNINPIVSRLCSFWSVFGSCLHAYFSTSCEHLMRLAPPSSLLYKSKIWHELCAASIKHISFTKFSSCGILIASLIIRQILWSLNLIARSYFLAHNCSCLVWKSQLLLKLPLHVIVG